MKPRVLPWAAVLPAAALASILGWAPAGASSAGVSIVDYAFSPASTTVPAGTTVVWTVTGMASHSVTSDSGAFDSGPGCIYGPGCLSPGTSFSHTFASPGTYTYHCRVHSTMHGTVTVAAAPPPPTSTPPTTAAAPPTTQPPPTTSAPGARPDPTTMPHPPTSTGAAPSPTTVAPPAGSAVTSPASGPTTTAGAGAGPITAGGGPSTSTPSTPTALGATRAAHHGGAGLTGALIAFGVLLVVLAGGGLVVRSRGRS